MRHWTGIAAGLALAACGNGDEQGAAGGTGGTSAGGNGTQGASGAVAGGGGSGPALQPGRWEMRTEIVSVEAPGIPAGGSPAGQPAPTTVAMCMTPEQAAQSGAGFFTGSGVSPDCRYENQGAGGEIRASVQCETGGGSARMTTTGRYTPTSYEVEQQTEAGAQGMSTRTRITARRVGDC
jgi:hypothetical protein